MLRSLRFAASVISLIACIAFNALWLRSQQVTDRFSVNVTEGKSIHLRSLPGSVWVQFSKGTGMRHGQLVTHPAVHGKVIAQELGIYRDASNKWGAFHYDRNLGIVVPYWFLVACSAALVPGPWIPWSPRYRLRTLLVLMTLAALVLGVIVTAR
jgi:hypothetical protein